MNEIEKAIEEIRDIREADEALASPCSDRVIWPAQCSCGHMYLEQYQFNELTKEGAIGFVWCGFCRTKRMVRPCKDA